MPPTENHRYGIDFFELQLRFAAKVASVLNVPLVEAVGKYTNIYVRLGMGAQLDSSTPDWRDYCGKLEQAIDKARWTHEVHCRRIDLPTGPMLVAKEGCFSYALHGKDSVRLHFHPGQGSVRSPLAESNQHLRLNELNALFRTLKASSASSTRIIGASWLYNLAPYRSLFPPVYIAQLQILAHPFQRMPLWGQFLERNGGVRKEAADRFHARIEQAASVSELGACFPFSVMSASARASCFYEHFGLYVICASHRRLTHGSSGLAPFGCAGPSFHSGPGAAKWSEPLNLNVRPQKRNMERNEEYMSVALKEVTAETVRAVTDLRVSPEQVGYVAANAVSISQAYFARDAWFRSIYAEDKLVGFAMLRDGTLLPSETAKPAVSLWRFMILQDHQGRGYGRDALALLVAAVSNPKCNTRLAVSEGLRIGPGRAPA